MNKIIKKIIILLIFVISLAIPMVEYAFTNQKQTDFFQVDNTEKSPGDILEMTIDFNCISYSEFEFILSSNINTEEIKQEKNSPVEIKQEENDLKMTIQKEKSNLDQIKLYYQIPEDISVGQKIILTATIEALKNEEEQVESNELGGETKQEVKTVQIEVIIIEKTENQIKENSSNKEENLLKENIEKQENEQISTNNAKQKEQQTNGNLQKSATNTVSTQNTVAYNGSSNNYLSNLKLEEQELTTAFSKTNTTYFATVGEEISKVEVKVETEDEKAKVSIYGNNDLQKGLNKILISVTAENGNVRVYRIYITREGSKA